MKITEKDRLERALKYLEDEDWHEAKAMEALEGINIREIIIIRNKKRMYMAELGQMIRNTKARIAEITEEEKQ